MKAVIIGNSGSGKTWLANRLAEATNTETVHLDHIFWQPGGFDIPRNEVEVAALITNSKAKAAWIAEGVFGELALSYLDDAEFLIWLDIEWEICKVRLEKRGSESKQHLGREQSTEGLKKLIQWASRYTIRNDMRSFAGHSRLYQNFKGIRIRIQSEDLVCAFVDDILHSGPANAFARAADFNSPSTPEQRA